MSGCFKTYHYIISLFEMVCKQTETPNEGCKHIPLEKNVEYCHVRLLIHFCERVKQISSIHITVSISNQLFRQGLVLVFYGLCGFAVCSFYFFFFSSSPSPPSGRFTITQILPISQLVHWHLSSGFTYDCLINCKQSQISEQLHKTAFYHIRAPLCLK